jgi:methyl-accepting chemotaxis protein
MLSKTGVFEMRLKKGTGMQFKLVAFSLTIAVLPALMAVLWAFTGIKKQFMENVYTGDGLMTTHLTEKTEQMIGSKVEMVVTLANMPEIIRMKPGELKPAISSVKEKNPDIDVVGVIGISGMQVARSDENNLLNLGDRSYFKESMAGKDYFVSEVLLSKTTKKPTVIVAAPIKENGAIKGVIHLTLKLDAINEMVGMSKAGKTGYSYIVDGMGKVIAHPVQQYTEEQKDLNNLPAVMEGLSGKTGHIQFKENGRDWLVSYTQSPMLKWVVVTQQPVSEATAAAGYMVRNTLIVVVLGAIVAMLAGIFLSKRIVSPIIKLKDGVLAIAGGNLAGRIDVRSSDEIGDLTDSVSQTRDNLREIVTRLVDTGRQLYDSAGGLSDQARQTSEGASEAAATMAEIAATVEHVSNSLQEVATASDAATREARDGALGVDKLRGQMETVTSSSREASVVIDSLSGTLNHINQIVDLINNIAGQTNLLALNAAIEAARAGEQGRGFAVVAEEVRKLAEQSSDAAKKITQMIEEVQSESTKAVAVMAEGNSRIKESEEVTREVGQKFTAILDTVGGLAREIQGVASSAQQVSAGVQDVSATTEEQTAAMEEVAAATEHFVKMAAELNEIAKKFKL